MRPSTSKVLRANRFLSSSNDDDDSSKKKGPKPADFLSRELLQTLDNAVAEISSTKQDATKKRHDLLSKLKGVEEEAFKSVDKQQIEALCDEVKKSPQEVTLKPSWWGATRRSTMAITSIRHEVFGKFRQMGKSVDEAHQLSETVTAEAEKELLRRRQEKFKHIAEEEEEKQLKEGEREAEYQQIFKWAQHHLEHALGFDPEAGADGDMHRQAIKPDPTVKPFFVAAKAPPCDVTQLKERPLPFWRNWDEERARITNLSFGPKNAIEEQIVWTEKGAMWPYPINNEYLLGPEEKVSFLDHVFLEPYLAKHNLPKTGPVAHFMELVCVGLSKNPYMTAAKKREHLDWFGNFFNKEMVAKVERLHEIEQQAALNS